MTLLISLAMAEEVDVEALLNKADDVSRQTSSHAVMQMEVKTDRYERTVKMEAWSKGTDQSLVVIREPAKEAGVATLMVKDNIWNYLPKVDKTMKVPSGMMSDGWMGSHVSNDDLVKGSRMSEDYTWTLDDQPQGGVGNYVITLTPRPDAPVVWGKVVITINAQEVPVSFEYFDEDGELERTMGFSDVRDVDGTLVPFVMTVQPARKPDEFTKITYLELEFDVEIDDSTFTVQALKQ